MGLTCRAHCSVCGRHFRSTLAFDLHRTGAYKTYRYCLSPERVKSKDGSPRLRAVTDEGTCEMYSVVEHDVEIWSDT